MFLDFLKALLLVIVAVVGVAALTWGLMTQPEAPEALAMVGFGLLGYIFTWGIGLYLTYR